MISWRLAALPVLLLAVAACSQADAERGDEDVLGVLLQSDAPKSAPSTGPALSGADAERFAGYLKSLKEATTLDQAYALAEKIQDLGRGAAPALKEAASSIPELPRIAALSALYSLREWDAAVSGLADIAGGKSPRDIQLPAAELLGQLASPRHEAMLTKALDNTFDVPVRVELSLALWNTAKSTRAKKELTDLLTAESENFRIQAAIALGRIGDIGPARDILSKLADEPTDRGLIAQEILKREKLDRELERIIFNPGGDKKALVTVDTAILGKVMSMLQERSIQTDKLSAQRLTQMAAAGALEGLDPYSVYLDEGLARRVADARQFRVRSLGIALGAAPFREGELLPLPVVASVERDSPAHRAGLMPGDFVFNVAPRTSFDDVCSWREGKKPKPGQVLGENFINGNMAQRAEMMRGAKDESVALLIRRKGWLLSRWVCLTHGDDAPPAASIVTERLPGGICYVLVHEFTPGTPAEFLATLENARAEKVKGLLLDLRESVMGSVEAAVQVAGMLLEEGLLVTWSEGRSETVGQRKEFHSTGKLHETALPLTVLVGAGTADSAEIVAAALQDYGRATIVGSPTFGRAIVQEVFPIAFPVSAGGVHTTESHAILLTTANFYSPKSERRLTGAGVRPSAEREAPKGFEGWVYDELDDLRHSGVLDAYVKDLITNHHDAVLELADGDGGQASRYPGWEAFRKGQKNHLTGDHLRGAVRRELRMSFRASGELKAVADLQEDTIFTAGLKDLAQRAEIDLKQYEEYRSISKG
ncbi:MAG: HEAT repeat domain-containing protein [Planctomycetaceae bacterium]|nr:HEAT repeat domain-containing protein [Planctomycetaceae bacterium]